MSEGSTRAYWADAAAHWGRFWVGYLVLAVVSIAVTNVGIDGAGIWLANLFAISGALVRGRSLVAVTVAVATAAGCAYLASGETAVATLVLASFHAAQVAASVLLLRLWLLPDWQDPPAPEQRIRYFFVVAVAMPLLFGLALAPVIGGVTGWDAWSTVKNWLGSQMLGAALVGAFLLLRAMPDARRQLLSAQAVGAVVLACAATAAALVWVQHPFVSIGLGLLALVFVLPVAVVALTAGCVGTLSFAIIASGLLPHEVVYEAALDGRVHLTISMVVVVPVFVSLLMAHAAASRRRLEESEATFRRSMENSAVGMAIVDINGFIEKVNRAFAEMVGYTVEELEGRNLVDFVHPDDRPLGARLVREAIAERQTTPRVDTRYIRRDGTIIWGQGSASVDFDGETGQPRKLICHIENIDERRRALQAVAEAESRWSFALASARQGVWSLDVRKNEIYYSAVWKEILGYRDDELSNEPGLWLRLVHPDDVQTALDLGGADSDGRDGYFEAEFRMRHKDGGWVWVLDRGKVLERDEQGRMVRAIGTHTDITRQKEGQQKIVEAARALQAEKDRLRVTLHSIGDAVICTDQDDRVVFMNAVAEEITGHRGDRSIGRPIGEIYAPVHEETGETISIACADAGMHGAVGQDRCILGGADHVRNYIRQVVSPILAPDGTCEGMVVVFQDFTDARALQRKLVHAASHDSLTGLANRGRFMAELAELAAARSAASGEHQMLFIDLDRFKQVNDTAGHVAGDALLKRIASTMRRCVRSADLVARLGGDEFAVILRDCAGGDAERTARDVVRAIADLVFTWEGVEHRVGASIGIATIEPGADPAAIVATADKGCYAAKARGRGTVSFAGSAPVDARLSA